MVSGVRRSATRSDRLSGLAVPTVFVSALNAAAGLLADLLNQERRPAGGTGFVDRSIPERILALGIPTAGIKGPAFSRTLLHQIAIASR